MKILILIQLFLAHILTVSVTEGMNGFKPLILPLQSDTIKKE